MKEIVIAVKVITEYSVVLGVSQIPSPVLKHDESLIVAIQAACETD
jgi:hypothetical protein